MTLTFSAHCSANVYCRRQKLRSCLNPQLSKVLSSDPAVSQKITLHASPTVFLISAFPAFRGGELRTQKLKSRLLRTQSLKVLPLKPGVSQCIATHATLTARDFFLANFYPSGPFTCTFSKPLPIFACVSFG